MAKRTSYQRFVEEEGDPRASLLVKEKAPAVRSWLEAHAEHKRTLELVMSELSRAGAQSLLLRRAHAAFDAEGAELVIAVGGDGTLLAASHNVDDIPILGVNSAPKHSVGFFCAATRKDFRRHLEQALSGKLRALSLARMSVAPQSLPPPTVSSTRAASVRRSPAATRSRPTSSSALRR